VKSLLNELINYVSLGEKAIGHWPLAISFSAIAF